MKKRFLIVGILLCTTMVNKIKAQEKEKQLDEVVVTATKFPVNKKNVGKIVYKITSEMLSNEQGKTLLNVLNDVPGIQINGSYGTKGQNLGYYIRGGRNKQVAILIDGINVNDPSSVSGDFDLRQIDINQIESIEILKGASSTLYGTGAATGVINIILKKEAKKEFAGTYTATAGSNSSSEHQNYSLNELAANFNFNGTIKKVSYLLAVNANNSGGLSSVESRDPNVEFKEDVFYRQNALLKLGYDISSKANVGIFGSFDKFSTDFDGFDYDPVTWASIPADKDKNLKSKQKRVGATFNYKYNKGELNIKTFITNIKRVETPSLDNFEGKASGFDVYANNYIISNVSVLAGLAGQYQDMSQKTSYRVIEEGSGKQHFYDPYVSVNYNTSYGLNFNAGMRLNIHSEYGNNFVYNVNPSYNFHINKVTDIKLFASYSTAFVTPTLSDIFTKSPTIEELQPEKDATVETGFEVNLTHKLTFNGTYFYREETDKIGYDSQTYKTINELGTFNAKGFETEINYNPFKKLQIIVNYTYVDRDESLMLKIPKNKLGIKLNYKISPSTFTSLSYKYVDATKDYGNVDLPSYNLFDFFINQKIIHNKVTLFACLTNIFNENYQEAADYTTRGRNYNLGLKIKL
ncbi:TonB-dependent receptor plug domain-containing protein [Tenacibaculum sp. UWU-22]|uniref:TonB-dependent receptor plug domain-containing protein n=1 Tax=Tenacibaculum sp. UWU-22 TaxID=3234187 RepID=UPI0034DAD5FA